MKTAAILLVPIFMLGACATSGGEFRGDGDTKNLGDAAMTPVSDLNLEKVDIPVYLATMSNPYADAPSTCSDIRTEVAALNGLLGEDLDVPEDEAERREQVALNATSDAVGSVLLPFRGVIRAVSGASSHDRKAREAYQRGLVRRAYLKGMAGTMNCPVPLIGA